MRRDGLRVSVICTSPEVALTCAALDLPIASLVQKRPDWAFDGADEVDPARNLIKGRGGAMFLEKVLMHASPENFILVDPSKLVAKLGTKFPIPVEVLPVALRMVEWELQGSGATKILLTNGRERRPVVTENGNFILDVRFAEIEKTHEKDIKAIPGVIESGALLGLRCRDRGLRRLTGAESFSRSIPPGPTKGSHAAVQNPQRRRLRN